MSSLSLLDCHVKVIGQANIMGLFRLYNIYCVYWINTWVIEDYVSSRFMCCIIRDCVYTVAYDM